MEEKKEVAIVKKEETQLVPDTANLERLAKILLDSGMWPQLKQYGIPATFAIIEYGRELGIPPVCALNTMGIVNGRLTMEAKAMLAVAAMRASVTWKILRLDEKGCVMEFNRPGFTPIQVSFTEEDAQSAGLLNKPTWKAYKKDMFFARCASRGIRQIAPDAVLGLYSKEEMEDIAEPTGEVIEYQPVKVESIGRIEPESKPEPEPESQKEKAIPPKPEKKREPQEQEELFEAEPIPVDEYNYSPAQQELLDLIERLMQYRPIEEITAAITKRMREKFGKEVTSIPSSLTDTECMFLSAAIKKTLEKEEANAKNKQNN